jgi:hypothetical protein
MQEYRVCTVLNREFHYTEFNKAKSGWVAIDGSNRHSISKLGKRVNSCLMNGLRVYVENKLVTIKHPLHPHSDIYAKHWNDVRAENPDYKKGLLRADLTQEVYIRCYKELGMEIPDYENPKGKQNGRKSGLAEQCLDYMGVPDTEDNREVKIGKYYVDGINDDIIYEFFGDYHHGNPKKFKSTDRIYRDTAKDKWERDKKRIQYIKERSNSEVRVIWESDWKDYQTNQISKEEFEKRIEIF